MKTLIQLPRNIAFVGLIVTLKPIIKEVRRIRKNYPTNYFIYAPIILGYWDAMKRNGKYYNGYKTGE